MGKRHPHPVSHEVLWDDVDELEMVFISGWRPGGRGCRVGRLGLVLALILVLGLA